MIEKAGSRTINKEACKLVATAFKDSPCQLHVSGVRVRGEKLYINFENMFSKEFFDKNKELFLSRMRAYYSDNIAMLKGIGLVFREVVSECEWRLPRDEIEWLKKCDDKADGEFINNMRGKNAKLFEEIRELIKKRKGS